MDSDAAICNLALYKIASTQNPIQILSATSDDQEEDGSEEQIACKLLYPQKRDELLREFRWPWAQRRAYPTQLGGDTWTTTDTYEAGEYVSFAPDTAVVPNPPESVTTFVYLALQAVPANKSPDSSPTYWRQISRAAWAYVFLLPSDIIQIHGLYHGNRNPREDQVVPYELGYEPSPGPGTILLTDAGLPWEVLTSDSTTPVSVEIAYTAQVTDTKQYPADFTEALAWALASDLALALRKDPDAALKAAQVAAQRLGKAKASALREQHKDPPPIPSHIAARRGRGGYWY